ncbi:MAG TPA: NADP-dependent malic enzyme [Candidatus Coprenecus stercorigallinarum]|nr:NADP-dependent malic enzyme [Candidatus Coprenecus stercorigallinarum]
MQQDIKKAALDYHRMGRPGKIETLPTKPYSSQHDLSLAYSPGVAYPCLEIKEHPENAYEYTNKGNLMAVISNGSAVLGLGNIGAAAGKPVMEGKALLFKIFAGLDCYDIEIDEKDPEKFIAAVKAISPTFGGINLEDIKAPECFEIERRLKEECDIPVMHDDQHGTAIISAAGLLNALELQGKKIGDIRLVVNGAGAAAIACTNLYIELGVRRENIVMCDSKGVITSSRTDLNDMKRSFATDRDIHTLAEALEGADVFLGLSVRDVLTKEMIRSMADRPVVFALANPDPEIAYPEAMASRDDLIFATGRSDYPNQINNVLGFPYIFRGALDVRATAINEDMKLAAVYAIADLAKQPVPSVVNAAYNLESIRYGREYILPKPLDPRLLSAVAPAVARAAMHSGVARRPVTDWEEYEEHLQEMMGYDNRLVRRFADVARCQPMRVVFGEGNTDHMLQAAVQAGAEGICHPILLGNAELISARAASLGLSLDSVEIINPRHPDQKERRESYASALSAKLAREGYTWQDSYEKMFERNYFGMMMVESSDADAFIAGTYTNSSAVTGIARDIIGIRPGFSTFATMHILNTKRGIYFLADTMINGRPDAGTLADIARLTAGAVQYYAFDPVIAMLSYSNFGSNLHDSASPAEVHRAVGILHEKYPDMAVDGEMRIDVALNKELRDRTYPFNRLAGKDVNTLIFPGLNSSSAAYRMMMEMGAGEAIGPIQIGLNKPVHFISVEAPVQEIVNLATVASMDAAIYLKAGNCRLDR